MKDCYDTWTGNRERVFNRYCRFVKGLTFGNEAVLNRHTVCSISNVSSHKLNLDPTQTSFTTNYISVGGPLDSFRDMRMVDLSQT